MSAFKVQRDLLGEGSDDDDDEEVVEDHEEEEEGSDSDDDEEEAATPGGSRVAASSAPNREKEWLASNFIKQQKTSAGIVYKSELLPDKVFFNRDKLSEFVGGKRYKKLLREMRKGMRTHQDVEKLKAKSDAKRERQQEKRQDKERPKRKEKRKLDASLDADAEAIERRKAAFQAKKARRNARKESGGPAVSEQ